VRRRDSFEFLVLSFELGGRDFRYPPARAQVSDFRFKISDWQRGVKWGILEICCNFRMGWLVFGTIEVFVNG